MDRPIIDHRGPGFSELGKACLDGIKRIFQTENPVVIFPASGTGGWEAALANTLHSGDRVVAFDNGHFASQWRRVAVDLGLNVELIAGDWRRAPDASVVAKLLADDREHTIKALMLVHSETSTGVRSNVSEMRDAIRDAGHPALLMVDTISSLGAMDYRHDEWGVDVAVGGSQKGLMLPPGLAFNAVSAKAIEASKSATLSKHYFRWEHMLAANMNGFFPYTPATNMLFGLRESIAMLEEEGLANVFKRHDRHAEAARRAVRAWGLETFPLEPAEYNSALTAVLMPEGFDEGALRKVILDNFDMSLGAGLGKLTGRVFRIGHLGHFNDLMLAGTLAGVEMGLELAGVPHRKGGVQAAMEFLTEEARAGLGA